MAFLFILGMPSSNFLRKAGDRTNFLGERVLFCGAVLFLKRFILQLFYLLIKILILVFIMSSIYYRRWTRMYIQPAAKYFKKYNVIEPGFQNFLHLANLQNPAPENRRFLKRRFIDHEQEINNKLINNLFLKYPDLKYESINRQKYHGDNFNSYSYSYAFITEQKKLIKNGYTLKKAFEIVQQKFQEKMKRKIDQTLISRGLAIGNRARSLMSIYQQQVQYESKLKMLRTKREVEKYEQKLKQIDQAIKKPTVDEQQKGQQHYQRIFNKITELPNDKINQGTSQLKRFELIKRVESDFQNMFTQFYETAAYKDRLRGLTDEQIKQNIMTSPSKIKRLSRELVKYLKSKGDISISPSGQLKMSDTINQKLKSFIYTSPTVKIAILNHLLGYESPRFSYLKRMETEARNKLKQLNELKAEQVSKDLQDVIKLNKLKELQIVAEKQVPEDSRVYRLLESQQERMLRLQIKYLQSFIKNEEKVDDNVFVKLKEVIEQFRRLKFRLDKRHKNAVQGELVFPEHHTFNKKPAEIQDLAVQYEDLVQYLRKKTEDRRLKALDQADDNKINEMIKKQANPEIPKSEGLQHTHN